MSTDAGKVIDLAAERARRESTDEPVVAALVVTYTVGRDGIPTCHATFSVDQSAIPDAASWINDWLPATAEHLLEVAARQRDEMLADDG